MPRGACCRTLQSSCCCQRLRANVGTTLPGLDLGCLGSLLASKGAQAEEAAHLRRLRKLRHSAEPIRCEFPEVYADANNLEESCQAVEETETVELREGEEKKARFQEWKLDLAGNFKKQAG